MEGSIPDDGYKHERCVQYNIGPPNFPSQVLTSNDSEICVTEIGFSTITEFYLRYRAQKR